KTIAGAINELKEKIKDKKFSEHIDVVYNIHLLSLNYKLDENNLDFNMQLYVNLNTCKILVNKNAYFYNSK
ncbi:hypothetical protein, partial [Borreliella garinii]